MNHATAQLEALLAEPNGQFLPKLLYWRARSKKPGINFMSKTRVEMIIETLRDNPERRFTARELAAELIQRYPKEMKEKQRNPRYNTRSEEHTSELQSRG